MTANEVLATEDVRGFFQTALNQIIDQRDLDVGDHTVVYVTNLLTTFMRSDRFYEWTPQGPTLTPLATLYGAVAEATSLRHRQQILQRMGDVALFMAGVFAESFQRKVYDVDYYIGMGGAAYGSLSECTDDRHGRSQTFAELSHFFADFVQVLAELCEPPDLRDDSLILRWYQTWLRTGSRRAANKLRSVGIEVIDQADHTRH